MPIVAPNEGLPDLLDYILNSPIVGVVDWELLLWVNDIVPDQDTVFADLTEATFSGYSRITITRGDWTAPVIVMDHAVSTYTTTPQSWFCSGGPETVYGYALLAPGVDLLRFIERFDTPVDVAIGGVLAVLPRVTLTTEVIV